jgi:hypothetical protein
MWKIFGELKMNDFTEKDKEVMLAALNFMLKSEQNALQASSILVPLAIKVQNIQVAKESQDQE